MSIERSYKTAQDATQSMATRFIHALRACEQEGALEPLIELFSDKALLGNLLTLHPYQGKEGAEAFWKEYRHAFREIRSHFTHVNGGGPVVALEWTSEGTLRSGKGVAYRGVSLIEHENGRITRFQAYYDTSAMVDHAAGGHASPGVSQAA